MVQLQPMEVPLMDNVQFMTVHQEILTQIVKFSLQGTNVTNVSKVSILTNQCAVWPYPQAAQQLRIKHVPHANKATS